MLTNRSNSHVGNFMSSDQGLLQGCGGCGCQGEPNNACGIIQGRGVVGQSGGALVGGVPAWGPNAQGNYPTAHAQARAARLGQNALLQTARGSQVRLAGGGYGMTAQAANAAGKGQMGYGRMPESRYSHCGGVPRDLGQSGGAPLVNNQTAPPIGYAYTSQDAQYNQLVAGSGYPVVTPTHGLQCAGGRRRRRRGGRRRKGGAPPITEPELGDDSPAPVGPPDDVDDDEEDEEEDDEMFYPRLATPRRKKRTRRRRIKGGLKGTRRRGGNWNWHHFFYPSTWSMFQPASLGGYTTPGAGQAGGGFWHELEHPATWSVFQPADWGGYTSPMAGGGQRGGYSQFDSNLPLTRTVQLPNGVQGGSWPGQLAQPPTFKASNFCHNNYNHFTGLNAPSGVYDQAAPPTGVLGGPVPSHVVPASGAQMGGRRRRRRGGRRRTRRGGRRRVRGGRRRPTRRGGRRRIRGGRRRGTSKRGGGACVTSVPASPPQCPPHTHYDADAHAAAGHTTLASPGFNPATAGWGGQNAGGRARRRRRRTVARRGKKKKRRRRGRGSRRAQRGGVHSYPYGSGGPYKPPRHSHLPTNQAEVAPSPPKIPPSPAVPIGRPTRPLLAGRSPVTI